MIRANKKAKKLGFVDVYDRWTKDETFRASKMELGFTDESMKVWSDVAAEVEKNRPPVLGADAPQNFETRLKMWGRWHDAGLAANRDSDGGTRRPYQWTEEQRQAWSNPRSAPPPRPWTSSRRDTEGWTTHTDEEWGWTDQWSAPESSDWWER